MLFYNISIKFWLLFFILLVDAIKEKQLEEGAQE